MTLNRPRLSALITLSLAALVVISPAAAVDDLPPGGSWFRANEEFVVLAPLAAIPPTGLAVYQYGQETLILFENSRRIAEQQTQFDAHGRPVGREVFRGGTLAYRERYRYRPDGSLRLVERCTPEGSCATIRYSALFNSGFTEEYRAESTSLTLSFDPRGRLLSSVEEGAQRVVESRRYLDNGITEIERRSAGRVEEQRLRDAQLLVRTVRVEGRLTEEERYSYDAAGRVVEHTHTTRGLTRVERSSYPGPGVREVQHFENDLLVRTDLYTPDGLRTETLFQRGVATVRAVYRGTERVSVEIIGAPTRTAPARATPSRPGGVR